MLNILSHKHTITYCFMFHIVSHKHTIYIYMYCFMLHIMSHKHTRRHPPVLTLLHTSHFLIQTQNNCSFSPLFQWLHIIRKKFIYLTWKNIDMTTSNQKELNHEWMLQWQSWQLYKWAESVTLLHANGMRQYQKFQYDGSSCF